jgi:hypothetical protein
VKTEKGKISRAEWHAIFSRREAGESFAGIARSYGCTAPAIRYIVKRERSRRGQRQPGSRSRAEVGRNNGARGESRSGPRTAGAVAVPENRDDQNERHGAGGPPISGALRGRVTSDVAAFLSAFDLFLTNETAVNRTLLRGATDRLLRTAARTLIELEREPA